MPPRKRRSYTAEHKVEAAHRVVDSGRTISEVARELGIDAGMLSVWVKDERRRHGLRRSMGATGICWDYSPAESFWSTFKHEHHYRHVYATKAEFVAAIDDWVRFYNSVRRHSALWMSNPDDYEKSLRAAA